MTHLLRLNWVNAGNEINNEVSLTADGENNLEVVVPGSTSDKLVAFTLDVSQLVMVYISSDQTVTLETNSSSAADDSLTITANKPLIWYTGCGLPNPFSADITALYLTRSTAGDATFKLRCLVDVTV